jgi:2-succinyl-5-enolpyruvyl-6-hydroxy-3-cyclohexene-1-carboxylate synthase
VSRHLDTTLASIRSGQVEAPDLLVRIGAPVTGRGLEKLFASHSIPQIIFDEAGEGREPHLHPSICIQGGLEGWISAFLRSKLSLQDEAWRDSLLELGRRREKHLADHLKEGALTEWHFHHELGSKLGEGSALFLGNSMPVRDFNDVFSAQKLLHVFTNRGLSGIDGLLASAAGVALGSKRETHALIGDLSTLHDLSSLAILSSLRDEISLTLWVLNNGGGEIFRIVPTSKTAGEAEWFTTPQEYDLASLAKAFRLPFARLSTLSALRELDPSACSGKGVRVIEVLADKETNLAVRRAFGEK